MMLWVSFEKPYNEKNISWKKLILLYLGYLNITSQKMFMAVKEE